MNTKLIVSIVIVIGVAAGGAAYARSSAETSAQANHSFDKATAHLADVSGGRVKLVGQTRCAVNTFSGKIVFHLTLRNTANVTASTLVQPWRSFDDGSITAGTGNSRRVVIGPHATRSIAIPVRYARRQHEVTGCRVFFTYRPPATIPIAMGD